MIFGKLALLGLSFRLREIEMTALSVFVGPECLESERSREPQQARVDSFSNCKVCTGLKVHVRPTEDQCLWKGIAHQGDVLLLHDIISLLKVVAALVPFLQLQEKVLEKIKICL